jgi:hypothetical protein
MTQTLNRHGSRLVILPPSGVWVVVMAAIGMMIVVAPRELVEAAGLLGLRRAYDHAFGVLVLLLTAWASWIVAGQAAVSHARSVFLNRIPVIFDRASTSERRLVMECVAQGGVLHRGSCDSIARSLCELGLLTPPPDDPQDRLRGDVAYTMSADVADVLRAHLQAGTVPPDRSVDDMGDVFG